MNERCDTHQADLSALLDGELDAREASPAIDHLTGCRACRDFWRGARALQTAAGSATAVALAPPADGWERIEAAVGRRDRGAWAWRVAAALLVGLGLLLTLRPAPPRGIEPQAPAAIEVRTGTGDMSERRFVELTTELLRADRDFHTKMLEVMLQVAAPEGLPGARLEGAPVTEDDPERGEPAPRRLPGGQVETS
jgi:predicted anti-sigma-YlaC factor YlaD